MKIFVCIKQVPGISEVKIDKKTGNLIRDGVPSIINPLDKHALELALQIKDEKNAEVIAISMGLLVYIFRNKCIQFSWPRINLLGFIASFNKGISGAGYGPIITSGQILSGMDSKSSVSISSFTESISCLVALIIYILKLESLHFILILPLLGGSLASIPFAVRIVKKSKEKNLVVMIGLTTITLGVATLIKIFIFR